MALFMGSLALVIVAGTVASAVVRVGEDEVVNVSIDMSGLVVGKVYELRASWPAIAPVKNEFVSDVELSVSDEKAVFEAIDSQHKICVLVRGIGKGGATRKLYDVPMNFSLDQQYYGFTYNVWQLIAWTLPILLASLAVGIRVFHVE